ncbi:MAG: InlB B-repeat-containing protein [Actinomycetota bacterium]
MSLTGLTAGTTYYYQSQATNTPTGTITPFLGYSAVQSFLTLSPPPTFTSISPASGSLAGGDSATITGTSFTGTTSVTIDGIEVTNFVVNSSTSITITTPAGTSLGAKNVVITTPTGTATGPGAYTYLAVVTFNANGGTGGTMPSQSGSSSAALTANAYTWTGSTFLGWNTAANGSGTAYAGGATYPFTSSTTLYAQWLTVASVAPPTGPLTAGTAITITGTGFTGATGVTIGGVAATSVVVVNATTITAVVPTGASVGAKDVVVTTPGGTGTGTGLFTYQATVTFNGNGSDGGSTTAQLASSATNLTANGFTRTGYTFAHWNTAANGSGTSYANSASFPFTADTTLYAIWTINTYTVTYNGNTSTGGTIVTDASSPYNYNATVTTKANTWAKTGNTFEGWNTAANGTGTEYAVGATFAITANTTLYAQWDTGIPTVTSLTGGSGDVAGGNTVTITGTNFSGVTGVTIAGIAVTSFTFISPTSISVVAPHNTTGTNGTKSVLVTTPLGTNTANTLYTYTVTVTFNANGGTGTMANQTASAATALTTDGFTPASGYTAAAPFWSTNAGGGGTTYTDKHSFPFDTAATDVTLYGQYTASTFNVIYNSNLTGTTGSVPGTVAHATGSTVTVLGNTGSLAKTGFTFAGWNTAADGSGTTYQSGATFTMPAAITNLYARWTATPTVTSLTGGSGDVAGGNTITITGTNFTGVTGVTIAGIAATSVTFVNTTTITAVVPHNTTGTNGTKSVLVTTPGGTNGANTLYTYTVTVTFNGNTNTGGSTAAQTASAAAHLTANGFTKTSYTFAHWNTAADGSGTSYNGGVSFAFNTVSADVTLYAIWTGNNFTLTYSGNGSTGGAVPTGSPFTKAAGSTITVLGNTGSLVLTNETFFDWNTAANGSGTSYATGDTFSMPAANTTLYAQWSTVTSIAPTSGTMDGGTSVSITGTNFTGATGATINGVAVTSFVVVNATTITAVTPAGVTGAAKDVVVTFSSGNATKTGAYTYFATVTFNANGGTGTMANQTASVATALTANAFTRSLFTFANWNTAADGSGASYADAASYPFSADITLYAIWNGPPSIITVVPSAGPLGGGTSVVVTGTNFTGATSVTIDGVPVTTFHVDSPTQITLTTPAGSSIGAKNLAVTTPLGTATGTGSYTYQTTVTFNNNGGSGTMANETASVATNLTANTFTRTNAAFTGWNTVANGSGTAYANSASYSFAANLTLYAQWMTVASVAPTSGPLSAGTAITITGTNFTGATGATINGVAVTSFVVVNSTTITAVAPAGASVGAKDIVVTAPAGTATGSALYTYNATVTFNGNTNTGGSMSSQLASTSTALTSNAFTKTGYTFAHWNTAANGSGTSYANSASFPFSTDTTLYAIWTANTNTITYAAGGGTGSAPSSPTTVLSGATFTTPANTYTRTGYTFAGWNDGTNTYAAGATYPSSGSITGNITLTATWTANTNTITYAAGGGTGSAPSSPTTVLSGATFTTPANTYTRTGYTFAGWNDETNTYAAGATYPSSGSITGNITLTAQWSINSYTVTYNGNSQTTGSAPTDPSSPYTYNSTVTVLGNSGTLVKTGFTFNGWNTASNGSGTSYAAGASFTLGAANVVLYALWATNHTVTFNNNTGSGSMASEVTGIATALTSNTFTKTGYTFTGWNTAANASGTAYADGATYSFGADITLYAIWTANTNTITYAAGGGDGVAPSSPTTVLSGATFTTPANTYTRTGYTFAGWNDGTNTYAAGATYPSSGSITGNITLTAQWTINSYAVTYDGNGSTGGTAPEDGSSPYTYNSSVTVLGNTGHLLRPVTPLMVGILHLMEVVLPKQLAHTSH